MKNSNVVLVRRILDFIKALLMIILLAIKIIKEL